MTQTRQEDLLEHFLRVSVAISEETEILKLFDVILREARAITNADAGTIYTIDHQQRCLIPAAMHNQMFQTFLLRNDENEDQMPPIPMYIDGTENFANASSFTALTGETNNIADVYLESQSQFNFMGPMEYDKATGYRTESMLVLPLKVAGGSVIGVLQLINAVDDHGKHKSFSTDDVELAQSFSSTACISLKNAQLIDTLKLENEKTLQLMNNEEELNDELKSAYVELDYRNKGLEDAIDKIRFARKMGAGVAGFILLILIVNIVFLGDITGDQDTEYQDSAAQSINPETAQTYTATPQVLQNSINLTGSIAPIEVINITGPFTGIIKEVHFVDGETVDKGTALLEIDTTSAEIELNTAKAEFFKAKKQVNDLKNWESNSEVVNARRSLSKSRMGFDKAEHDYKESQLLLAEGIVSRDEVRSAKDNFRTAKMDFEASTEAHQKQLDMKSEDAILLAEAQLLKTKMNVEKLEKNLANNIIRAPVTGIVLFSGEREDSARSQSSLTKGAKIEADKPLLTVQNTEGFSIRTSLNEIDILKVRKGQPGYITGEAFKGKRFEGKVAYRSSQAKASNYEGSPKYDVILEVTGEQVQQVDTILMGMSVMVEILTRKNDSALLVPLDAVKSDLDQSFVFVKQGESTRKAIVMTGATTLDSVEIIDGVNPGDIVLY